MTTPTASFAGRTVFRIGYGALQFERLHDRRGAKTENARVTVVWNGVTVHDDVAIDGPTGGGAPEGPTAGAVRLQDHDNAVRYRNITIEPR